MLVRSRVGVYPDGVTASVGGGVGDKRELRGVGGFTVGAVCRLS